MVLTVDMFSRGGDLSESDDEIASMYSLTPNIVFSWTDFVGESGFSGVTFGGDLSEPELCPGTLVGDITVGQWWHSQNFRFSIKVNLFFSASTSLIKSSIFEVKKGSECKHQQSS